MSSKQSGYKWSEEETERFIKLRMANEALFTGKYKASKLAWEKISQMMGLQRRLTGAQAAKKWENLKKKYKDLKTPPTGAGTDQGETTANNWQWFSLMHEAAGSRPSITPPVLIASCTGEEEPSTSTATFLPGPPEIPLPPSSPQDTSSPHPSPPPKRSRRDPLVEAILREGQRDERRFRSLEAQTHRLLGILEKMVDKM